MNKTGLMLFNFKSCLTLLQICICNLPGSRVHGIRQARILEWIAINAVKQLYCGI